MSLPWWYFFLRVAQDVVCRWIVCLGRQDHFSESSRLTNCRWPSLRLIWRMHFFFSHWRVRLSFEVIISASLNVALDQIPEHFELSACVCMCVYARPGTFCAVDLRLPSPPKEKKTNTHAASNRLPQISACQNPCVFFGFFCSFIFPLPTSICLQVWLLIILSQGWHQRVNFQIWSNLSPSLNAVPSLPVSLRPAPVSSSVWLTVFKPRHWRQWVRGVGGGACGKVRGYLKPAIASIIWTT